MSRQQKNRIKDLKYEKIELKSEIALLETDIKSELKSLESSIKDYESEVKVSGEGKKKENSTNSIMFIIISTLVEFIILIGVYFNEFYKYRSYSDFKKKIENEKKNIL